MRSTAPSGIKTDLSCDGALRQMAVDSSDMAGVTSRERRFRAEALECVSTQQFSYDELVQPEITHIATRKDYKIISYRAESPWQNGYHKSLTHSLSKSSPPQSAKGFTFHFPCTGDEGLNIAGTRLHLIFSTAASPQFYR